METDKALDLCIKPCHLNTPCYNNLGTNFLKYTIVDLLDITFF